MFCRKMVNPTHFSIFFKLWFNSLFLEVSLEKYGKNLGGVIGEELCKCELDKGLIENLMEFTTFLSSVGCILSVQLIKGVRTVLEKFVHDKGVCLKCLKAVFTSPIGDAESKLRR